MSFHLPLDLLVLPEPPLLVGHVLRELVEPLIQFGATDFEHEVGREDYLVQNKYYHRKKQFPGETLAIKLTR